MNALQELQRRAEIALAIEAIASLALLALFVWAIVWSIKAFNRWERRDEAKVKALTLIAARLSGSNTTPQTTHHHDDFRASR